VGKTIGAGKVLRGTLKGRRGNKQEGKGSYLAKEKSLPHKESFYTKKRKEKKGKRGEPWGGKSNRARLM